MVDDYRRAAAQYGDDPNHYHGEHQTSNMDAPQQARPLEEDSHYRSFGGAPGTPEAHASPGEAKFGHGHVMFAAPESPGYVRAQLSHDAYPLAPPLPQTNVVSSSAFGNEHDYEYEQAREASSLERERLQAEANTRENDDDYAADATIMPAKHVFPVHAVPAVTKLQETSTSRVDSPSQSMTASTNQYSREQPPPHNLVERGSARTLTVGDWTIRTIKRPILNGKEIDAYVTSGTESRPDRTNHLLIRTPALPNTSIFHSPK